MVTSMSPLLLCWCFFSRILKKWSQVCCYRTVLLPDVSAVNRITLVRMLIDTIYFSPTLFSCSHSPHEVCEHSVFVQKTATKSTGRFSFRSLSRQYASKKDPRCFAALVANKRGEKFKRGTSLCFNVEHGTLQETLNQTTIFHVLGQLVS